MSMAKDIKDRLKPRFESSKKTRLSWEENDFIFKLGSLKQVDKNLVFPDPNQPRKVTNDESLEELMLSIEEHGMLQPILVVETEDQIGKYKILTGERRWQAAINSNKINTVPVIIRSDLNDDLRILLAQVAENVHRQNMSPLETANAYRRIYQAVNNSQDEAAKLLNISKSRLCQVLAVLDAPDNVKSLIEEGLTSDVNVIAGLSTLSTLNTDKTKELVEKIQKGELKGGGLRTTVKDTIRIEKNNKHRKIVPSNKEALPIDPQIVSDNAELNSIKVLTIHVEESLLNELKMVLANINVIDEKKIIIEKFLRVIDQLK